MSYDDSVGAGSVVDGAVLSFCVEAPSPLSSGAGALAAGGFDVLSRVNVDICSTFTVVPGLADKLSI